MSLVGFFPARSCDIVSQIRGRLPWTPTISLLRQTTCLFSHHVNFKFNLSRKLRPLTPHSDMKKDELWHHQRSGISLSYKTMQKILGKKYSYESYVFWEKSFFFLNESEQIFQVFPAPEFGPVTVSDIVICISTAITKIKTPVGDVPP